MRLTKEQKFKKTIVWLRREFSNGRPRVHVRMFDSKKNEGECRFYPNKGLFVILIKRGMCLGLNIDAVIHEWAHTMSWPSEKGNEHSREWGIAYAKIYRAFLVWNYGRKG